MEGVEFKAEPWKILVINVEPAEEWHSRQRDQLGQRLGGSNQRLFRNREESGRFFWLGVCAIFHEHGAMEVT